jgi:hypothetical protein
MCTFNILVVQKNILNVLKVIKKNIFQVCSKNNIIMILFLPKYIIAIRANFKTFHFALSLRQAQILAHSEALTLSSK